MTESEFPFTPFPKMARLSREVVLTEKIDGCCSSVRIIDLDKYIAENPELPCPTDDSRVLWEANGLALFAGSRNRYITLTDDNYGFAGWVYRHKDELLTMGAGNHFGEYWGSGIQRKYGLTGSDKRWSVFNTTRWCLAGNEPKVTPTNDPRITRTQDVLPECAGLVPELYRGDFNTYAIRQVLDDLGIHGSYAVPGWKTPEGIVVTHLASGVSFKKTILNDSTPKSKQ